FTAVVDRREAQHLEDDLVLGLGALGARVADVDAVGEHAAVHADQPFALALEVGADELARGPLQHAQHFALGGGIAAGRAGDADQYLVAGGGVAAVVRGDGDLGAGLAVEG